MDEELGRGCWWMVKGQGNDRLFNPSGLGGLGAKAFFGGKRVAQRAQRAQRLKAWRMMRLQGFWWSGGLLGRGTGAGVVGEGEGTGQ